MPTAYRDDPCPACKFEVEVNGISDDGRAVKGSFAEVSGLEVEIAVIEYRNGSEDATVRKIPGPRKYSNITLKRGTTGAANIDPLKVSCRGETSRARRRMRSGRQLAGERLDETAVLAGQHEHCIVQRLAFRGPQPLDDAVDGR